MDTKQAVQIIRFNCPKTLDDFKNHFRISALGQGCYRHAYSIDSTNLILKIENSQSNEHTAHELKVIEYMRRSYRQLLCHIPTIIYSAPGLLVMPKYSKIPPLDERVEKLRNLLYNSPDIIPQDMHFENVMLDCRGNLRLTDMGQFRIIRLK